MPQNAIDPSVSTQTMSMGPTINHNMGMPMMGGMGMNTQTFNKQMVIMQTLNSLRTGDAFMDMIIGSAVMAAIGFFTKAISGENFTSLFGYVKIFFMTIYTWISEWWNRKPPQAPKPAPKPKPEVPMYRVIIRHEYRKKLDESGHGHGDKLGSDDTYITDNDKWFDAMFHFLSQNPGTMNNGEIAMRYVGACNYDHERYRKYTTMVKPLEPVDIDGFMISLNEEVHKPLPPPEPEPEPEQNKEGKEGEDGKESDGKSSRSTQKSSSTTNRRMVMRPERRSDGRIMTDGMGNPIMVPREPEESITYKKKIVIESRKKIPEILEFIKKIYDDYINHFHPVPPRKKREKEPKFIYMMDQVTDQRVYYQRMLLETRMTFDYLFFPGKEKFIRRIDEFKAGQTPYSKFTMLLHGKPGGGKTSFIKALHQYTDCNVICVRLDKFRSIKQLMDTFHDTVLHSEEWNREVPINKRIYLLEDVDAADKIVLRRDKEKEDQMRQIRREAELRQKRQMDRQKENKRRRKERSKLERQKDRLTKELKKLEITELDETQKETKIDKIRDQLDDIEGELEDLHSEDEADLPATVSMSSPIPSSPPPDYTPNFGIYGYRGYNYNNFLQKEEKEPSIKLADILNLLDGVLELNGCYVILTTNYKDRLDDALTRPGRITFDLELGEIQKEQMHQMIERFIPNYREQMEAHSEKWTELDHQFKFVNSEEHGDYTWAQLLEHYMDLVYQKDTMPCRFETFCINEDEIKEVIINMDDHLQRVAAEEEKKRLAEEEARRKAKEEAEAEARRQAEIDARIEENRQKWMVKQAYKAANGNKKANRMLAIAAGEEEIDDQLGGLFD